MSIRSRSLTIVKQACDFFNQLIGNLYRLGDLVFIVALISLTGRRLSG
jgi:hypothetical protein